MRQKRGIVRSKSSKRRKALAECWFLLVGTDRLAEGAEVGDSEGVGLKKNL